MGEQDHLFLPSIKRVVKQHVESTLYVVKNSGHVVNVEQPEDFNKRTIDFLKQVSLTS